MNVLPPHKLERLREALLLGASTRAAARYAGCAKQTAQRWKLIWGIKNNKFNRWGETEWDRRQMEQHGTHSG